jgi:hypothetical protein
MPSNQWGPYFPQASYSYPAPIGSGVPTAPATPAQSPSGSVTNQSAPWNYTNSETSTQFYLDVTLNVDSAQQGQPAQNSPVTYGAAWANAGSVKWQ